jgi:hypothetical protein
MTLAAVSDEYHIPFAPHVRRLRTAALAAAFLLTGAVAVTSPPTDTTEATTYKISNTGGVGVRQRTEPRAAAPYNGVAPEGAAINMRCQMWGDAMGNYGNRLWFEVTRSGVSRPFFVPDTYTNTPRRASDPALPGIPMCGTGAVTGPSTTTRPASGSYIAGNANYRYCTNTGLQGCAVAGMIAANTAATMHCWIDDSHVSERYASNRWFYVTAGGQRGFVHSSRVERQNSVPHCSQHRGIAASRWAAMKVGSTTPTSAERNGNPSMDRWSGWCYVFATDAFVFSTGVSPKTGTGSARNAFFWYRDRGRVSTDLRHDRIPIGSIIFWTNGDFGHAAIHLGGGLVATTQGDGTTKRPIAILPMSHFGTPAGYVTPNNI